MSGGAACSVGFNVGRNNNNRELFLTAGHCTVGLPVWTRNGFALGPSRRSDYPDNDYGLVRIDDPTFWNPVGEVIDTRLAPPTRPITTVADGLPGAVVCKTGATTSTTCGQVLRRNVSVVYGGLQPGVVNGLTVVSQESQMGDSGGPVYDGSVALGLVSGCLAPVGTLTCVSGPQATMFYQPVGEALLAYGVKLLQTPPGAPDPEFP